MSKYMSLKDFDYDKQYFFKTTSRENMNNVTKVAKLIEARKDFHNAFDKFYDKYLYNAIDWENDKDYEKFCDYMAILAAVDHIDEYTDDILNIPRPQRKAISNKLRELINEIDHTTTED